MIFSRDLNQTLDDLIRLSRQTFYYFSSDFAALVLRISPFYIEWLCLVMPEGALGSRPEEVHLSTTDPELMSATDRQLPGQRPWSLPASGAGAGSHAVGEWCLKRVFLWCVYHVLKCGPPFISDEVIEESYALFCRNCGLVAELDTAEACTTAGRSPARQHTKT